jgi:hypothetical protein
MSRMLEAQAQAQLHSSTASPDQKKDVAAIAEDTEGSQSPTSLAVRLKEILAMKPEEVISGRILLSYVGTLLTVIRVSVLAAPERSFARLYVYHAKPHLLLCLPSEEICSFLSPCRSRG